MLRASRTSTHYWVMSAAGVLYGLFIGRSAFRIDGKLHFTLFDDAMISMVYARNLVEGWGLRWNPGEPAVEGYSNLLWTLCMALVQRFTPEAMAGLVVMLMSMACLLANLFVVGKIAGKISNDSAFAVTGSVALTAFSFSLMYWSLRGMEVGLVTLLVGLGLYHAILLVERYRSRDFVVTLIVLSLTLLTRPDAALPVGIIALGTWLASSRSLKLKTGLLLAGVLGGTLALQLAFRYGYYHELVPNTYYLKVTGTPFFTRVQVGSVRFLRLVVFELWPILVLGTLGTPKVFAGLRADATPAERTRTVGLRLLISILAAQCLYSIYVGGDAWEELRFSNRYISIALPAGYIIAACWLSEILGGARPQDARVLSGWLVAGGAAALFFVLAYRFIPSMRYYFDPDAYQMAGWRFLGYAVGDCVLLTCGLVLFAIVQRGRQRVLNFNVIGAFVIVTLVLATSGTAFASWTMENAPYIDVDIEMAKLGVALRQVTTERARLGVVWAGAPSFFSHRRAADLLGKNDPVIARMPPRGLFRPGHNKWDLRYSINTYHPDLLIQTFRLTDDDREFLGGAGYSRLPNGIYLRRDTPEVDAQGARKIPYQMRNLFEEPSARPSP